MAERLTNGNSMSDLPWAFRDGRAPISNEMMAGYKETGRQQVNSSDTYPNHGSDLTVGTLVEHLNRLDPKLPVSVPDSDSGLPGDHSGAVSVRVRGRGSHETVVISCFPE